MANNQFTYKSIEDRLNALILPITETGCWIWMGSLRGGYGRIRFSKRGPHIEAHRFMYERLREPIPEGLVIDHLCRVRCCVNPQHMECVTGRINTQRGNSGKHQASRTHCPQGHEYTEENIYYAKRRDKPGALNRICRACGKLKNERTKESRRAYFREYMRLKRLKSKD